MPEPSELSGALLRLIDICREAGKEILDVYDAPIHVESKDDRSPLTMADRRSHELISRRLNKVTISGQVLPVLSEEGKDLSYEKRKDWEHFWLVDPLDGTKEFIRRNGEFTVNIALVSGARSVLGLIHVPVTGITYFAVKGIGAFRLDRDRVGDSEDIFRLSRRLPCESLARPLQVIGSRSHMSEASREYVDRLKEGQGEIAVVSAGSSLKFCLVAEGKADVYPRFAPTMEWDTAAGQVLVEETGGAVIRVDDRQPLVYNKKDLVNPWFLAVNSMLYENARNAL